MSFLGHSPGDISERPGFTRHERTVVGRVCATFLPRVVRCGTRSLWGRRCLPKRRGPETCSGEIAL